MLIQSSSPSGRNRYIQRLQAALYSSLKSKWGLADDDTTYECYEAAYRNTDEKSGEYVAEIFTVGNEYKEVYWNDNLAAISFFSVGDNVTVEAGIHKVDVALIFFCNLVRLKPSISHRADEEVRQDVITLFGQGLLGFAYKGYETSLTNVLREYPGSRRDDRLRVVDMQPVHCFRINLQLSYNPNKNC
jgi:hypothetical protein